MGPYSEGASTQRPPFEHMDDAADRATIVDARLAARVCRQMRLDLGELRVRQPEEIAAHGGFLSEAENQNPLFMPTLLWARTLISSQVDLC